MKMTIERTGGMMARKVSVQRDGAALTQDQLAALSGVFQRAAAQKPPSRSESFSYLITVEDEHGTRKLRVDEAEMPKVLSSLLPD